MKKVASSVVRVVAALAALITVLLLVGGALHGLTGYNSPDSSPEGGGRGRRNGGDEPALFGGASAGGGQDEDEGEGEGEGRDRASGRGSRGNRITQLQADLDAKRIASAWWEDSFHVNTSKVQDALQARRQHEPKPAAIDMESHEMVTNIVLVKTHKTASTTMASILFRFGASHNLQFYLTRNWHYIYPFAEYPELPQVNITLYHHRSQQMSTRDYARWYLKVVPRNHMITILREPFSRALSDYHFFIQPDHPDNTLESFLRNQTHPLSKHIHLMSNDLGVRNDYHMNMFLSHWHSFFSMFLITEQFDESLVLMKRKFKWRLEDIVYMKLLETCKQTARQWDSLKVTCPQKKEHLDEETLGLLAHLIRYDIQIYEFARKRLNEQLAAQPPDFWVELAQFRTMQKRLNEVCSIPWQTLAQSCDYYAPHCRLFSLTDLDFEKVIIDHSGNLTDTAVKVAMLEGNTCAKTL